MNKFTKVLLGTVLGVALAAGSTTAAMTWSRSLSLGARGADVKTLQQFLNMCADTKVAVSGAGSPGMETTYFGPATKAAVIKWQAARGVSPASGLFGPLSRAKAAALQASTDVCGGGTVVVTPQSGPVSAMLSTDNPASGSIVAGQATADLLHITFTGSGTVNSVTLQRSGVSDQNTLTNVYLYDGVTRLTDGYTFNTNGTITMNNLNLAVNGSRTISVKADVAYNGGSGYGYDITTTLVGFTAGTSVNTVNIKGNQMFIAGGASLATASVSGANTVSAATVNAGTSSYAVWRAPLQVNTRTLWLKAANFRITGSAPTDALSNVGLYIDGVKVGTNAMMTMTNGSNYLSFNMSGAPVQLTTGSHTVEVRADVVKGASYNFTVSLQQASDLMVYDPQVGVNLALSGTIPSTAGIITIGAGSATLTVDPTFSAMTNVTGGASNATIAKFKVHGYGEDVKVTSLPVTPVLINGTAGANSTNGGGTCTGTCGLQNVTLYFNGSQVGSQQNWTSGALTFNLGSQLIIPAGMDSTLEVRADLRTTGGVNWTAGTVSANLGAGTGEGWSSHQSYTTPAVNGTTLSIQTGLLAVAKNTGYANQSVNPNTAGVKIGSFVLQNQSSSESVRVTSLNVGLYTDAGLGTVLTTGTTPALTNFAGLRTSETSGSGSTPVQPQGSNVFSVDFTLAPGATKTIDIYADTSSATGTTVATSLTVNAIGASSNISICVDGDNNCGNGGTGVAGQLISLSSGTIGTPTILSASSTTAQYIAAGDPMMSGTGATDGTKATFNFVSNGGASTISELKFTVTGANTVMSVRVGSVTAPVVSGVAWLQGLNLAVPNGGAGLTIDAYVTYAPVGTSGIASATTSSVALTYVKYTSGGTTTPITPSVSAPTMTLVGSKPTVVTNTTQASGLILGAENKIGEVTVSADAKGNIKLNDIKFNVGSSNITTFAITSARIADGTTTISGSSCGANATATTIVFCEFGTVGNTFATGTTVTNTESNGDFDGYTIAAGTSKTFTLYGVVGGTVTTAGGTTTVSTSVDAAGFNWDDTSTAQFVADGTNASPTSGTALTGTLIYNFPTGSYSIKQ